MAFTRYLVDDPGYYSFSHNSDFFSEHDGININTPTRDIYVVVTANAAESTLDFESVRAIVILPQYEDPGDFTIYNMCEAGDHVIVISSNMYTIGDGIEWAPNLAILPDNLVQHLVMSEMPIAGTMTSFGSDTAHVFRQGSPNVYAILDNLNLTFHDPHLEINDIFYIPLRSEHGHIVIGESKEVIEQFLQTIEEGAVIYHNYSLTLN